MSGWTGRIVVGFEGSLPSRQAVRWAAHEAVRRHSALTVLFVLDAGGPATTAGAGPAGWWPGAALERARALAQEGLALARTVEPELTGFAHVQFGPRSARLVEASREADLLVVGTRGRGGFAGLLLGSVSQRCTERAPCPIVVVPGPAAA